MTLIQIEIISDPASAWCYIGKKRLDQAISLHRKTVPGGRNDTFQITWRPYYLDSTTSTVDNATDGNVEKRAALERHAHQIGESVGIRFSAVRSIGSTRDAHRLISLAQRQYSCEAVDMLVNKIFEAYHELGLDISSSGVLKQLAIDAGLDISDADALLNSSTDVKGIDGEAQLNREILNGAQVPHFTIQNQKLEGAQDIWNFMVIFGNIKKKEEELDVENDDD